MLKIVQKLFIKIRKAIKRPQLIKIVLLKNRLIRRILGIDKKLVAAYTGQHSVKKIHLGCGDHELCGWLNTDSSPLPKVVYLDATKTFPFPDGTFDYVFSEHLIEHMNYAKGLHMLSQCYRILKPGGRIRIATPDLGFLIALCATNLSGLQQQYIKWMMDTYMPEVVQYDAVFVVNYFFRNWEHCFIYDEKTLRWVLEHSGFTAIARHNVGSSQVQELKGIENQARMPAGFLALETIVLEAVKPV
ncbi:MAG: methyltransferase domain-containing protein [Candidatus Omnitrophota bacterium]